MPARTRGPRSAALFVVAALVLTGLGLGVGFLLGQASGTRAGAPARDAERDAAEPTIVLDTSRVRLLDAGLRLEPLPEPSGAP